MGRGESRFVLTMFKSKHLNEESKAKIHCTTNLLSRGGGQYLETPKSRAGGVGDGGYVHVTLTDA